MRKIFERIEKNNYLPVGTAGHGFNGYFQTNMNKPTSIGQPVTGIIQAIAQNFSISTKQSDLVTLMGSDANFLDPKRDFKTGIWGLPIHGKANGERYSSRDYIQDTINKKFPLKLSLNSLATRVLFSNSTSCGGKPKATGVEFLQGKSIYKADSRYQNGAKGVLKTAVARKEVILSGGTFNTPQLLSECSCTYILVLLTVYSVIRHRLQISTCPIQHSHRRRCSRCGAKHARQSRNARHKPIHWPIKRGESMHNTIEHSLIFSNSVCPGFHNDDNAPLPRRRTRHVHHARRLCIPRLLARKPNEQGVTTRRVS